MQARALGRRFGETACLFHRRGSPRVPVSLTAGSSGCLASLPGAGEPRRGVWGSSLRLPYLPPPAPPAQGEQGMEVLAAVCLSEGPRWSAVLPGRLPGPPLRADMPLGGVGAPQAAGRGVSRRRAARPLTKPGSGPCTYALPRRGRPCAGRAGRALRGAAPRRCFPGCRARRRVQPRAGVPALLRSEGTGLQPGCLWGVHVRAATARPGPLTAPLTGPASHPRAGAARPRTRRRRTKVTAAGADF